MQNSDGTYRYNFFILHCLSRTCHYLTLYIVGGFGKIGRVLEIKGWENDTHVCTCIILIVHHLHVDIVLNVYDLKLLSLIDPYSQGTYLQHRPCMFCCTP